jgi:excisionase family DNA binding protein
MKLEDLGDRLFVSAPEAAAILGCDARTVRTAAEAGEIPASRAGVRWLIPVQWLREQAGASTAPTSVEVDYDRLASLVTDRLFDRFAAIFGKSPAGV